MNAHRIEGITAVVAGVPQERALLNKNLTGSGGKVALDEIVTLGVGHVSVVKPDLPPRLQRIIGDALDEGAFPFTFPGDVTGVGGVDGGLAQVGLAEDVNALMRPRP